MLRNESVTFGNTQNYAAIVPDITKDIFSTKCYFFHNKYKLLLMIFFTLLLMNIFYRVLSFIYHFILTTVYMQNFLYIYS